MRAEKLGPGRNPPGTRPVPDDRQQNNGDLPGRRCRLAGWMGHHFRRIFHSREGTLELHLSLLSGVAQRYEAPFFNALKQYSHRLDTPPAANSSDPQEPGI